MTRFVWRVVALISFLQAVVGSEVQPAELPAHYFQLMRAELDKLDLTNARGNPGAMLAAAVLYSKDHAANPDYGRAELRDLALRLGDRTAEHAAADMSENKQDYEWEIHFWLDTFRLLESQLGSDRRARWQKELETITRWFAGQVEYRLDFPRYQGPYIRTSTNHLALFASEVYLAGRVLGQRDWEQLGARALHRLAAEEQTPDGYWGEHTDNGPATGYNYITLCCVALYHEHSQDPAAREALRRATDFHKHFTWPDGTPVETINGRNRHWAVSPWGQFAFSHWPDGRRYAGFLAGFFQLGRISSRDLGRLAQNALYYHDGPTEPIPQELPTSAYRMNVPAGIRKTGPWIVCLSGLIDRPIDSQFTLDRQGHLSIFHEQHGLIITGANSKHQPELATFRETTRDGVSTIPLSSRLRMADDRDRLGLGFNTFFAELEVPRPTPQRLQVRIPITETGRGRLQDAEFHVQLRLQAGQVLETGTTKIELNETRVELSAEQLGGVLRHGSWTLRVPATARLVWPVLPFNPYANGPEKDLRHAVGVVSIPVVVAPPAPDAPLNWRRGEISLELEMAATGN